MATTRASSLSDDYTKRFPIRGPSPEQINRVKSQGLIPLEIDVVYGEERRNAGDFRSMRVSFHADCPKAFTKVSLSSALSDLSTDISYTVLLNDHMPFG